MRPNVKSLLCVSTHVAPTRGFGGPSTSFRSFLNALDASGVVYDVIASDPCKARFVAGRITQERIFHSWGPPQYGITLRGIWCVLIRARSHQMIVANGITTPLNFSALLSAMLWGKKILVFGRGSFESGRTKSWGFFKNLYFGLNIHILKCLDRRGSLVVAYQTEEERFRSHAFGFSKSLICGNVDGTKFTEYSPTAISERTIDWLFVGRCSPEKGIDRLVFLMQALSTWPVRLNIALVLEGDFHELKMQAENLLAQHDLKIYSLIQNEQVLDLMKDSRYFYFPSKLENFGNTLVEAVACGCVPVVYGDTHWSQLLELGCAVSDVQFLEQLKLKHDVDVNSLASLSSKCRSVVYEKYIFGKDFTGLLTWMQKV